MPKTEVEYAAAAAVATVIKDADGDTKVDTEESADEDIVRMDVAGTEAFKLNADGILDLPKQSGMRAYKTGGQEIPNTTSTKIQLSSESYDIQNEFDSTTNYRFTATVAGYYQANATVMYQSPVADKRYHAIIKKNGAFASQGGIHSSLTIEAHASVSDVIYLAVNDYLELWTYHNAGGDESAGQATPADTFMSIAKIR